MPEGSVTERRVGECGSKIEVSVVRVDVTRMVMSRVGTRMTPWSE